MVSYRRREAKNPSPLFSVLHWLRILCSGCFGKIDQFKRPLLPANPNGKLHLRMDNAVLQDCLTDSIHSSSDHLLLFGAADAPTVFRDHHEVHGDDDDDDDEDHDDYAENEESEGMFHGHFLLGSRVLTEVELQSPVEETRVLPTPIRTPIRSSNSSFASSTRELHSSSSQILDPRKSNSSSHTSLMRDSHLGSSQVCTLDSDSCSSSDVIAVVSPTKDAEASLSTSMSVLSMHTEEDESLLDSYGSYFPRDFAYPAAQLYKFNKDKGLTDSSLTGDLVVNQSLLNAETVYLHPNDQQSNITGKRKKCQARAGYAPECNVDDALFKEKNTTHRSDWVAAEKHRKLQEGQHQAPVGSLPECMSSAFLAGKISKKNDCKRSHARSLTDQDFTELKGCIDLGFVFPPDHVPDLCETLPALEVCYAVAHGAISPVGNMEDSKPLSPGSPPISPWRIASPGDQPQQVKARLRHWAQAVACNVRHPC